jgi:hypothetical protein
MKIRTLTAIAGLVLGATACTPQEVAFWHAYHAEHPAGAEQLLSSFVGRPPATSTTPAKNDPDPPAVKLVPNPDGNVIAASPSCPPAVTFLNTDVNSHAVLVQSGPHQMPLTQAGAALAPGEAMTVDLTAAVGQRATAFSDGGAIYTIDITADC